jgi:hypothetical protein
MTNLPHDSDLILLPDQTDKSPEKLDLLDPREKQRIDVLLKVFDTCIAQERAIKDEESKWVTYLLAFYAAFLGSLTFVAKEILNQPLNQSSGTSLPMLLWGFALLAVFAHLVFARAFSVFRFAYYRVRARLQRTCQLLRLDDPSAWPDGKAIQGRIRPVADIAAYSDWVTRTLPRDSFVSRLLILMLGHMPAWLLLLVCFRFDSWSANATMLGIGVSVPALTATYQIFEDYRHFLRVGRRDFALRIIASLPIIGKR